MNLLLVHSFTWIDVAAAALISFILGFILKSTILFKQRKRILRLEDEMLSNHSSILELEKAIVEARKEKNTPPQDYDHPTRKSEQLRVS